MVPGKDGLVLGRILPFNIPHPQPVLGDEALQTHTLFLLQGLSSSPAVEQAYIGGLQAQDRDRHQLGLGVVALEIQHELLQQRAPQETGARVLGRLRPVQGAQVLRKVLHEGDGHADQREHVVPPPLLVVRPGRPREDRRLEQHRGAGQLQVSVPALCLLEGGGGGGVRYSIYGVRGAYSALLFRGTTLPTGVRGGGGDATLSTGVRGEAYSA